MSFRLLESICQSLNFSEKAEAIISFIPAQSLSNLNSLTWAKISQRSRKKIFNDAPLGEKLYLGLQTKI